MLNNQYNGITVEDLEKAASVRLFEKAAAAEGINLNEFSDTQVDDLYSNYQHSSEENTMNEQIFDLFEKQAAYEGVDLDALSDEELAYVFDNFVDNLESEYADYDEYDDYDGVDEEEEAYEKLAEAEILGRHMARAYMDELVKEAANVERPKDPKVIAKFTGEKMKEQRTLGQNLKELLTGHEAAQERATQRIRDQKDLMLTDLERQSVHKMRGRKNVEQVGARAESAAAGLAKLKKQKAILMAERAKGYGKRGLALGALGAAGYGAKKMMQKEAANEAIYDMAFDRAEEFLKEGSLLDYDGSTIDNLAIEVLTAHGYVID